MLVMQDRIMGIRVSRIWFDYQDCDSTAIVRYVRLDKPIVERWNTCNAREYTVISDLTDSEEQLKERMRKKVRYEINRASKEDLKFEVFLSSDESIGSVIDSFDEAYKKFAEKLNNKEVLKAYSKRKIDSYLDADCLAISRIEKDNLVVFHVYVFDEKECVLLFSVSDFREDDIDNNLAGRANKYLHYKDMCFFKEQGLTRYDWGNISSKDEPNGIDNFKLSFGGSISDKYNCLVGNGALGGVLVSLYKRLSVNRSH